MTVRQPCPVASLFPTPAPASATPSPSAGAVHLEFHATHGTSHDVLHKGPGESTFTHVADDIIQTSYHASGLPAGAHEYQVVGRNSRGDGPASEVSTVNVS